MIRKIVPQMTYDVLNGMLKPNMLYHLDWETLNGDGGVRQYQSADGLPVQVDWLGLKLKVGSCLALFYINEMNQVISYWLCRD